MKKFNVKEMAKNKSVKFYGGIVTGVATGAVVLMLGSSVSSFVNKDKIAMAEQEQARQEQIQAEIQQELYQKTMQNQVEKSERVVNALNNEVEVILLTEDGSSVLTHDRPDTNWFTNASIDLMVDYQAVFSMPIKSITMLVSADGTIFVEYNLDYLDVKSIDLVHNVVKSSKGWFGDEYNPQEVAALVSIIRQDLKTSLESNDGYRTVAQQNLEQYIRDFAAGMGVYNLYFQPKQG